MAASALTVPALAQEVIDLDNPTWYRGNLDNAWSNPGNWIAGVMPWATSLADFQYQPGEVDTGTGVTVGGIRVKNQGFIFVGGPIQLTGPIGIAVDAGIKTDIDAAINLSNMSVFDIGAGGQLNLHGVVTTPATLEKKGDGTLQLNNELKGAMLVSDGTLSLGYDNGQAAGGVAGRVTLAADGTLITTNPMVTNRTIGSLAGTGQVILRDADLHVGSDNTDSVFAGTISGPKVLRKVGSGLLELAGTSIHAGTFVDAGTLLVTGTHQGLVTVNAAGRLGGGGTIGSLIANAGTVAPGKSIGTLNVAGNILLGANSILEVEVDATGAGDRLVATGLATLAGGTVNVIAASGTYPWKSQYVILTATGGIDGTFGAVTDNFAFLDSALIYTPTSVMLTMARNDVSFAEAANSANQAAVANALALLPSDSLVTQSVLMLTPGQEHSDFDSLSGESFSTTANILSNQTANAAAGIDRINQAFDALARAGGSGLGYAEAPLQAGADTALGAWLRGYGGYASYAGANNAAASEARNGGLILGGDTLVENVLLGVQAGYGRTGIVIADRNAAVTSDDYTIGAYAGTEWETLSLALGAAYTRHQISSTRSVTLPGLANTLNAVYGANTTQVYGELAHDFDFGPVAISPYANVALVNYSQESYAETGGSAALSGAAHGVLAAYTTLGLRTEAKFVLGESMLVTVSGAAGWRHAVAETTAAIHAFANGTPFSVTGTGATGDALVLNAGISAEFSENATLTVKYDGQISDGSQAHQVNATIAVSF